MCFCSSLTHSSSSYFFALLRLSFFSKNSLCTHTPSTHFVFHFAMPMRTHTHSKLPFSDLVFVYVMLLMSIIIIIIIVKSNTLIHSYTCVQHIHNAILFKYEMCAFVRCVRVLLVVCTQCSTENGEHMCKRLFLFLFLSLALSLAFIRRISFFFLSVHSVASSLNFYWFCATRKYFRNERERRRATARGPGERVRARK